VGIGWASVLGRMTSQQWQIAAAVYKMFSGVGTTGSAPDAKAEKPAEVTPPEGATNSANPASDLPKSA
jgi:hypothetical protein